MKIAERDSSVTSRCSPSRHTIRISLDSRSCVPCTRDSRPESLPHSTPDSCQATQIRPPGPTVTEGLASNRAVPATVRTGIHWPEDQTRR